MSTLTITKSIRLSPNESAELSQLSAQQAMPESALLKKWVLDGIRTSKLKQAIQAYLDRQVDLRGGAALAGISYNRFMRELELRNIVTLEDSQFLDSVDFLAGAFDSPVLGQAVASVKATTGDITQ